MRAAPAVSVKVSQFGVWRISVASLSAMSAGAGIAWAAEHLHRHSVWLWSATAALTAMMLAVRLTRRPGVTLRWDGQNWQVGLPEACPDEESASCWPEVMIDTGHWMLLRLHAIPPHAGTQWLPVQRGGLEPHWQALRAAIYSPRPMNQAEHPSNE